uniref:SH2 domain-containing protein n=1 Tax=Ascaris lumbricoides TaxID=6252 RepID=A0A0M3HHH9_ASCLU
MVESIEGESWYHGLRPKEDVVPLLKDVGDWLVRAIEGNTDERNEVKIDIVLSVMIEAPNKVFNYLLHLNQTTNMWVIASTRHLREFATPLELIEYYEVFKVHYTYCFILQFISFILIKRLKNIGGILC